MATATSRLAALTAHSSSFSASVSVYDDIVDSVWAVTVTPMAALGQQMQANRGWGDADYYAHGMLKMCTLVQDVHTIVLTSVNQNRALKRLASSKKKLS